MTEPLSPAQGWGVLHLFIKSTPNMYKEVVAKAIDDIRSVGHQVVLATIIGHKADACMMLLGPDLRTMRHFQTTIHAAGMNVVDSYISLTEVSEYAPEEMTEGMKRPRLYPKLPPEGKKAFCFYPMAKRRGSYANWYTTPFERRRELLYEHGMSGRKFSDRVLQLVTGSTGLDDWEWGVTLFGKRPDDIKECVYTMRYDEASAVYAEFGKFYTGIVGDFDEVMSNLQS